MPAMSPSVDARDSAPAAVTGPQRPVTPDDVLRQFRAVARSVNRHFHAVERQCGISGSQLGALAAVTANPGLKVTELAQRLALHQSTASNLIDLLVRKGLLERRRSDHDLRVVRLHATAAGERLVARAPVPLDGLLTHALRQLDAGTLTALHGNLVRLMDSMSLPATGDGGAEVGVAGETDLA